MASPNKTTSKILSTLDILALAKSRPNKWLLAVNTESKVLEQHWLCWKNTRMYHFIHQSGQPRVIEVSIFKMAYPDTKWKI